MSRRHVRNRHRRIAAGAAVAALVAALLVLVPGTATGAPSTDLSLAKGGDTNALVGGEIGYTLTATNPAGAARLYNLSFRDVLPVGVTYLPGSTSSPEGLGDPRIVEIGPVGSRQQVLIWSNVSDLPAGARQRVSFRVQADPSLYPVGSTVHNSAEVYAQSDPRTLPKFDAQGLPVAGTATDVAAGGPFDTRITAIRIDKSEASPEHELLRGVHEHPAVYTLKVTNNSHAATNANTVVDYLPAGLEFLGCGGEDNGSAREYGGRTLAATPAPPETCRTPVRVETVLLADGEVAGLGEGVYTKVTWDLSDLAPGGTWTTQYRAGVPQRANTMFGADAPSATGLGQGANLDNNTGADTRELESSADSQDGETGLTNLAQVQGSYTGDVYGDGDPLVLDDDAVTVAAEDLSLQKSVDPTAFAQGEIATYTLKVRTGEYADAAGIVVTDVIPDGLCPLREGSTDACAADASEFAATGASVDTVTENGDGTWTVVFAAFDSAHDGVVTITYRAWMRANYIGHGTAPTVSGDGYTNRVSLVGTTTSRDDVNAPDGGDVAITGVRDASEATITSDGPALSKTIAKQATPYSCDSGDYTDNEATPKDAPALTFRPGDRVCFTVRVDFSAGNATKNPVLTDFLPGYVDFEAATPTSANTVTVSSGDPVVDGHRLEWTLGDPTGTDRFVVKGQVFEWRVSALVTSAPDAAPVPDITANLAKLVWEDTGGDVGFLRDQVDFSIGAVPPVTLDKARTGTGAVVSGQQVPYTITVTNDGTAGNRNDVPVTDVEVWDRLPAGVACAAVADQTPAWDSCVDGSPSVAKWTLPGPIAPGAGAAETIGYTMTIPTDPRVLLEYTNTTGVRSFDTATNLGGTATHHPEDNIDPTVPADQRDVPRADDTVTVTTQNTVLTKSQATSIDATGNNAPTQAVIGEEISYTVRATVPAHTTVYQGQVGDPMPTGIELLSASATLDGAALPADVTLTANTKDDAGADAATLTLPATYTNDTGTDRVFAITITARVTPTATDGDNRHGTARTNRATFTRKTQPSGGSNLAAQNATSTATIVEPSPALAKSHTPSGTVTGGQEVTFTLAATNAAGRPTLHDAYVDDCVPVGLTVQTPLPTGMTALDDGCGPGSTQLHWSVGDVVAGTPRTISYTVTVEPGAAGGQVYTNTATLLGSDLDDGVEPVRPIERGYTATADDSLTVAGSELTKSTSTPKRTIGQRAEFTVTTTLPEDVAFHDAVLLDSLPAGLDPATVDLTEVTCSPGCSITATALSRDGQRIGWFLGDLVSAPQARTITLTYTALVVDDDPETGNRAGASLVNSARFGWNLTDGTDPTSAATTPTRSTTPDSATVTITEPKLTVDKEVSTAAPAPGETFDYTVTVRNPTGADVSAAHDVTVVDTVPVGVVVDEATIAPTGTLAGQTAAGGGTVTWTIAGPLAAGDEVTLGYQATLASPTPGGTLTNTAEITEYHSLPGTNPDGRSYDGPEDTAEVKAALPHVSVVKAVVDGDRAYAGEPKTWRITVTSDNAAVAHDVDVTDTLPHNWSYVADSARVSVAGGTATAVEPARSGAPATGQQLTWTDLGDLTAQGQTIVVTFRAMPSEDALTDPGVGHGVDHTNTATTTAEDANGNTSDAEGNAYDDGPATAVAHLDSADLRIVKAPQGTPVAGRSFTWTLTVHNDGPDTAVGPFAVTDTMPAPLTSVTAVGDGWSCTVGGTPAREIDCARADATETLAEDAAFPPIEVAGTVPADTDAGAELANTATVTGKTHDPDPDDNTDTSTPKVTLVADLGIEKSLVGTLTAGADATYTLDVTNHGPSDHHGPITVTDAVPAGTTFVSVTGTDWTCDTPAVGATGTVTCTYGAAGTVVAAGTVLPQLTASVKVDAGRTTSVTNVAEVQGSDPDPNPTNDTATVDRVPGTSADLAIDKESVGTFKAGARGTYRMTVSNAGPSAARGVTVKDSLPAYLSFVTGSVTGTGWTCGAAGQDVTCTLTGTLPPTEERAVEFQVDIESGHTGKILNTATVESDTTDPVPANDSDTDDPDSVVEADLAITKSHVGPVVAGEDVSYALEVTNTGPSDTGGPITVTDTLPDGMTCVTIGGVACSGQSVTHTRTGTLAKGGSFTVEVVAHVAADAGSSGAGTTLVNTATVAGPAGEDPDPSDNTATDPTPVVDRVEVSVDKTPKTATVHAGDTHEFTLTVHNDGPSDADGLSVVDVLPPGMSLESISGAGWDCTAATITCTRATLAAGATSTITVKVAIGSGIANGTVLDNVATLSTSSDGDDPANNESTAAVTVTVAADLVLTKEHDGGGTVSAGTPTTYTIGVRNDGPSDTAGPLTVTDTLPTGFSYVGASAPWSCTQVGQKVTCERSDGLVAGASAEPLRLTVQVDADADETDAAVNTARVDGPVTDPEPGNDTDDATVEVVRTADLAIVKSHPGTPGIGEEVRFSLQVSNAGPGTARGVEVTDTVPAGLDEIAAEGKDWTCTVTGRQVTCSLAGVLAPKAEAPSIVVSATIRPAAYPSVTNVARVESDTADAEPGNNRASDTVPVAPVVDLAVAKVHNGTFAVGKRGTYTLTVRNAGPTEVPGTVTVADPLPDGLGFVAAGGEGWTCADDERQITCTRAGLAVGATSQIAVTVDVLPAAYPSVTNTATVGSEAVDTDPSNDAATDVAPVTPDVGLSLSKELTGERGGRLTWQIAVTNTGTNATTQPLVVTDDLPVVLGLVRATGSGWSCTGTGPVVCQYAGALAAGDTATLEVVTTVDAAPGAEVVNAASVSGGAEASQHDSDSAAYQADREPGDSGDSGGSGGTGGTGDGTLPGTGGPLPWLLPVALLLVVGGAAVTRRYRPER